MSHIDEWARLVLICMIVAIITLPIWIVPWTIWFLIYGRHDKELYHHEEPKYIYVPKPRPEPKKPWSIEEQRAYADKLANGEHINVKAP